MKRCVIDFVFKCLTCQQDKAKRQLPGCLLKSLYVPDWKWEYVTYDFVSEFLKSPKTNDFVWVVVNQLTKSAYFIMVKVTRITKQLAKLSVDNIVTYHGIPKEIVSDRNPLFISHS